MSIAAKIGYAPQTLNDRVKKAVVDYQTLLRKHSILISRSGRGNCNEHSMVETFFLTIKSELIWPVAAQSRQQAENAVVRYNGGFHLAPPDGFHLSASGAPSRSSGKPGR